MMIVKSKLAQIIYQTVYCTLAVVAVLGSLGYFKATFNRDFYVYYTYLSNYICAGMMTVCLVLNVKNFRQHERPQVYAPHFKFMCVIMILVTCAVYNLLLARESTVTEYFFSISNLLNHVILPLMFILDWVLFYEHGKVRWYDPLLCVIMPMVYVVYILIRAAILSGVQGAFLYPYFFLDLPKLGVGMFLVWISALLVVFVAIGYLLYVADNLARWRKRKKIIE